MAKRVQHEKPPRDDVAKQWIEDESALQKKRYASIVEEIDALQPQREGWIKEFLRLVRDRGFYVTGDMRAKIPQEKIPSRPDREDADRVVW